MPYLLGLPRSRWALASIVVASLAVLVSLNRSAKMSLVTDPSQVGTSQPLSTDFAEWEPYDYDVIIVGGGTAGCVLASRLSEAPEIRVLLLEAGGSGKSLLLSRIPSGYGQLFRTPDVYQFYTQPQEHASGKRKFWPRGKMLGGSSSVNAQIAQFAAPEDYDEWARITGDPSWAWDQFGRFFRRFEQYVSDPDYPEVDSSVHGRDGPVRIGYFNYRSETGVAFVNASMKLGIPYSPDFNSGRGTLGVNRLMTYIDEKAQRVSTETAYLSYTVLARRNLKVLVNATVTQILFDTSKERPRAVGVEFSQGEHETRYRARAKKEVIVSGGALHSPQILMLSGIGPAVHLKEFKIPVVKEHPGVGAHLTDHPVFDIHLKDKLGHSTDFLRAPQGLAAKWKYVSALGQYLFLKKGPFATNWGEAAAFLRSDDPKLFPAEKYPKKLTDTTSGSTAPDLEIFTTPLAYKDHGGWYFDVPTLAVHVCLLRPRSEGVLRLQSTNPWTFPSVDPNYCKDPEDVEKIVRGIKTGLDIIKMEPFASFIDHEDVTSGVDNLLHGKTDEELIQLVRERVETLYHPMGTCRMGHAKDGAVVDTELRVYGVDGLRVCDASIFPTLPSGHTTAPVIATAEKLADQLRSALQKELASESNHFQVP